MDDTAQKPNQTSDDAQTQAQSQPQAVVNQTPVQQQSTPVGSLNKEAELAPVADFVKPTETPAIKDKEVAEAGVSEVSQRVELSREHELMGLRHAAETTPVKIDNPIEKVQLPLDQTQAQQVVKTNKNSKSSIVWMAILMLKHFKQMQRKLLKKED